MSGVIEKAFIVSGLPHILLAHDVSPNRTSLYQNYARIRQEIENSDADMILYFSSQWLSVIGYLFQADPSPKWNLVDMEWHELGTIPYQFKVDADFAGIYAEETRKMGFHAATVNYHGFPIDTGTVVAQKLINPENRLPAAMVSCNMYSEKNEMLKVGQAAAKALARGGKKAVAVVVSNLSNRFYTREIDQSQERISSAKDHEWNLKVLELLGEGRLEDVDQCAREFAREANGDMGFRGVWWLNGLCGQHNHFTGKVYDYQAVYGTGAALVGLFPTKPIQPVKHLELESESEVIEAATHHDPHLDQPEASESTPQTSPIMAAPLGEKPAVPMIQKAPADTHGAVPVSEKVPEPSQAHNSRKAPPPVGPYPHARRVGEFLFLSGVGPRKPGTKEIPGVVFDEDGSVKSKDVAAQTESVIENIRAILEDAGSSMEKVVDVQVFLTDMKGDFQTFNEVYGKHFAKIGPTRTTVEVLSLPTPIAVEFKVVARA